MRGVFLSPTACSVCLADGMAATLMLKPCGAQTAATLAFCDNQGYMHSLCCWQTSVHVCSQ